MKIRIINIVSISILIGLVACTSSEVADSKDVSQSQIYQKYYASWDAENESTYVEAVYRFGGSKGTSLVLSQPSTITVNDKELNGTKKLLRGYVYGNKSIKFNTEEIEFSFTNTENIRYKNAYTIIPIALQSLPDSFYRTNGLRLTISGRPLNASEEFHVKIKDSKGLDFTFKTDLKGSSTIYIEPSELSELSAGLINIQITRVFQEELKDCAEIGGFSEIEYHSKIYTSRISYNQISNS
ncbi:MAG: hypothetical protein HN691_17030 [Bacteroidetes bacterium]|nr:hypothetical protein [Bacteroidota bacterium]MBT7996578.1 hypothetical protein [Bacteroidota bacterium]